jgi:hypothetical protein
MASLVVAYSPVSTAAFSAVTCSYRSEQGHAFHGGMKVIDWRGEPVIYFFSYRSAAS